MGAAAARLRQAEEQYEEANGHACMLEAEIVEVRAESAAMAAEAASRQESLRQEAGELRRQLAERDAASSLQHDEATRRVLDEAAAEVATLREAKVKAAEAAAAEVKEAKVAKEQADEKAASEAKELNARCTETRVRAESAESRAAEAAEGRSELERELKEVRSELSSARARAAEAEGRLEETRKHVSEAGASVTSRASSEHVETIKQLVSLTALVQQVASRQGVDAAAEGGAAADALRAKLTEARTESHALTRRLAEASGRAEADQQRAGETIGELRRQAAEAHAAMGRVEERLEESERLSTQRAAAAAAERREAATLRGLLESAQARHEAKVSALEGEIASAKAHSAPVALSARQLPALMDALEVCQRERQSALREATSDGAAAVRALGESLRALEAEYADACAAWAVERKAADETRIRQLSEVSRPASLIACSNPTFHDLP